MEYLPGYTIKPSHITQMGEVFFTDGTNFEIRANQITCQAYGYTYDIVTGTCRAYRYNTSLDRNLSNINNKFNGIGNTTELGTNTIQINGTNNTTKGFNNNCLINGSDNEIANGVDNATVLGSNGRAIRDGEFVIGSADGVGQTSTFFLNGITTDTTSTALFINGDTAVTTIAREPDFCYYYTIDVHAFRTGGTSGSGSVHDRAFFTIRGMVNDANFDEAITLNVSRGLVVGWTAGTAYIGAAANMQLKVNGAAAMDIKWTATANFYAMKI